MIVSRRTIRHEGHVRWKNTWTLSISGKRIELCFLFFVCFALSMTDIFPELHLVEIWVFVVREPTDSFKWEVFKTGEAVDFGDLSIELRC